MDAMTRTRMTASGIVGALICLSLAAYALYLLVDALRSGTASAPPAVRYRRESQPFNYWLTVVGIVGLVYMCLFTLVGIVRPFCRR
jgi:hypothetical protein